jgi:hypothetical protein
VAVVLRSKARETLSWPPKVTFEHLVDTMVDSNMNLAAREGRALEPHAKRTSETRPRQRRS